MDMKFLLTSHLRICIIFNLIVFSCTQEVRYSLGPVPVYRAQTKNEDLDGYIAGYLHHLKAWAEAAKQTNKPTDFKETFKHHLPHISRLAEMGQQQRNGLHHYRGNQLAGNVGHYTNEWFANYMKHFEEQYLNRLPQQEHNQQNPYDPNYNGLAGLYTAQEVVYPPQEVVYPPQKVILPPPPPLIPHPVNYHKGLGQTPAITLPYTGQSFGQHGEVSIRNQHHSSTNNQVSHGQSSNNFANLFSDKFHTNRDKHLAPHTEEFYHTVTEVPTKNKNHHVQQQYSFHSTEQVKGHNGVTSGVTKYEESHAESHEKWSSNNNKRVTRMPQNVRNNNGGRGRYSGTRTESPAWGSPSVNKHQAAAAAAAAPSRITSSSAYSDKMDSMVETGCMDMMKRKKSIMGDQVTWNMLENVCHQCMAWNRECRKGSKKPSPEIMKWWNGLMHDEPHHVTSRRRHKRQARSLPQRREYRLLSDEERHRFHEAVIGLKNTFVGDMSRYDVFVLFHQPGNSPAAHFGPAFYGWHREMLTRFENALQEIDDRIVLPYWDSRMDGYLGERASRESITWTDAFFGNLDGEVTTGPFAGFRLLNRVRGRDRLFRERDGGRLMTDSDVANAVNARSFRDITFFVDPSFEAAHGAVHNWIGGVFGDLMQSPSDPIFFLHHAFIDCVWEAHRRSSGNFSNYPDDTEALGVGNISPNGDRARNPRDSIHHPRAPLRPFDGLLNIDAHSRYYTDREYSCATPPTCSDRRACGSPYLFCDEDTGVCLPRLRQGARCDDFGGFNPCYEATCCNGRCESQCGDNRNNNQGNNRRNNSGNNRNDRRDNRRNNRRNRRG